MAITTRRRFIASAGSLLAVSLLEIKGIAAIPVVPEEPVIDAHQHLRPGERTEQQMLTHQRVRKVAGTILLPLIRSGDKKAAQRIGSAKGAGGNEECYLFARKYPKEFFFAASAVPGAENATAEIEAYLKRGAVAIGEMKFNEACDSRAMQKIYQLAQAYDVPVIMHWQYGKYNHGFERFYKMLEKYPRVNFVGHAQTWWANIDKDRTDQSILYPKGKVNPGGITDRYLSDYPNMFGDLSAGSGLNGLTRDTEHTHLFLKKHQDKLVYGSDCEDVEGLASSGCTGALGIAAVRKLSPDKRIERKLLYENAKRLYRL